MRRALVFLLVLALGLALLLWSRRREEESTTRPFVPDIEGTELPPLIELPMDPEKGEQDAIQVGLGGKLDLSVFAEEGGLGPAATRPRLYHLVARDSRTLGGDEYELTDATFELFDPVDAGLIATLVAARARVRLRFAGQRLVSDRDEDARLWDVTVTLHRRAPVVPMSVRVPYLQGAPDPGRYSSSDRVQLLAEGLEGQGLGLELDLADQRFALVREGRVDLALASGERVTLEAVGDGPIEIDRLEEGGELELRALEGARALLQGAESYEIGGRTIHLRGPMSEGAPFRPRVAEVRGQAVLTGLGHVFRAAEADVFFDALGEPSQARLTGDPVGNVRIGRYLEGSAPGFFAERAEVAGKGPLVVTLGERTAVRLEGPGSIVIPDKRLAVEAGGAIEGRLAGLDEGAPSESDFSATGGVRVTLDDRILTSESVDVHHRHEADGARYEFVTSGATRVVGTDRLERRITLDALGGASMEARENSRIVREAREVRLAVEGLEGFTAHADRVRELDLEQRSFIAEGNVVYEVEYGRGSAERVVARGERDVLLTGSPAQPATFELWKVDEPTAEGRIRSLKAAARQIRLFPGEVHAEGEVVADVLTPSESLRLECATLDVSYQDPPLLGRRSFKALARGDVVVQVEAERGVGRLGGKELELAGVLAEGPAGGAPGDRLDQTSLTARGEVWFEARGPGWLSGSGDLLTLSPDRRVRLSAGLGRRVRALAASGPGAPAYELAADWIELDEEGLQAGNPALRPASALPAHGLFHGKGRDGSPPDAAAVAPPTSGVLGLRGRRFVVRRGLLELVGDAHAEGTTPAGEAWTLDAGVVEIRGRWDERSRHLALEDIDSLEARDGFVGRLGERLRASGRRLRAEGSNLRIEGLPGRLEFQDLVWTSDTMEIDRERLLIATGKGVVAYRPPDQVVGWSLRYESMQPTSDVDATILAVSQPVFASSDGVREVRASWALLWLDRQRWFRATREFFGLGEEGRAREELFVEAPPFSGDEASGEELLEPGQEQMEDLFQLVRELYVEGNIEFLENERRRGRATALYFDRFDGNGWLYEGDVLIDMDISGRPQTLRAKAQWMRLAADLRTRRLAPYDRLKLLEADRAVISFCEFDEPDYVIETGELRIVRDEDSRVGFAISARKNKARIRGFGTRFDIPLPPLGLNEEGEFSLAGLKFGSSARFGNVLALGGSAPLSSGVRQGIGDVFGAKESEVGGSTRFQAGWLGSRGPLIGLGQTIGVADRLWLSGRLDTIPDGGEDRGLVRVPESERSDLRTWLNARGRMYVDADEWFDLAFNYQTDAGIQSEFYEGLFVNYEERDNFLHWRKADAQNLYRASAKLRLEDFRTEVEELPKLGFQRGLTPLFTLADRPVLYATDAQLSWLRRREGYAPFSPFGLQSFADGLGDREVLRFDNPHRLDYALPLGYGGLVLTPFTSARLTLWNEGVEQEEFASRLEAFAGAELATTLWRRWGENYLHEFTPSIGVRSELVDEKSGDQPVVFDARDLDVDGEVLDLGLRNVWRRLGADPRRTDRLDLELRTSWGSEQPGSGFLPLAVLGQTLYFWDDIPIGLLHDGRYDFENGDTVYSSTALGFEPHPQWTFGAGYSQGRDSARESLYRAASVSARFRATSKWTLELVQNIGLLPGTGDEARFVVRRFGHDFVSEFEFEQRSGEGFSFGIGVRPLVGWKPRPLGLIDDWLGLWR